MKRLLFALITLLALTVQGANPSFQDLTNNVSTTNLTLLTNLVANLGTAQAGTMKYASDVITPYGTGGYVWYDGVSWRLVRDNLIATTSVLSFITNAVDSEFSIKTPITYAICLSENWQNSQIAPDFYMTGAAAGTAATFGASSISANGPFGAINAGTDVQGNSRILGAPVLLVTGDMAAGSRSVTFAKLQDSTDKFLWYMGAVSPIGSTTNYPTSGAFVLYDMWNISGHGQVGAITNHYILVNDASSTFTYTDSGVTPSVALATPDRITWVVSTTNTWFFINGVQVGSVSQNQVANGTSCYFHKEQQIRAAGTGSITVSDYYPSLHIRRATPLKVF